MPASTSNSTTSTGNSPACPPTPTSPKRSSSGAATAIRQIDAVAHQHVTARRGRPSDHLVAGLGRPPADRPGRDLWEQTAATIESYRLRWEITDPDRPLGGEPDDPLQQTDHRRALAVIDSHQQRLAERERTRGPIGRGLSIGRSR